MSELGSISGLFCKATTKLYYFYPYDVMCKGDLHNFVKQTYFIGGLTEAPHIPTILLNRCSYAIL